MSGFATAIKSVVNLDKILALLTKSFAVDFGRIRILLLGCDKQKIESESVASSGKLPVWFALEEA